MIKPSFIVTILIASAPLCGCLSYYERNQEFQTKFESDNFGEAQKYLENNKKLRNNRNRVIYDLNYGTSAYMNGNYQASIDKFLDADYYIEDYTKSLGGEFASLITNPEAKPYKPEYFEQVLLHYYQALNFINLNNYEDALVECRRMNVQLQRINDSFKKKNNKYCQDAFAHNLMGIIYESTGDYNNAFIAYRNAATIYDEDYTKLFNFRGAPLQLRKDLIRTAKLNGFTQEAVFYEKKYNLKSEQTSKSNGSLVVFVHNGKGPIKGERVLSFVATKRNGLVTFSDNENGFVFPIFLGTGSSSENDALSDLDILCVSFPKFIERKPNCRSGMLSGSFGTKEIELAEDINAIAFESLRDRLLREVGSSILRLAVKEGIKRAAAKKNEYLGLFIGVVNAVTEKSDTRNWQTLPHSIYYSRIELPEGEHEIKFTSCSETKTFNVNIKSGKTTFLQTSMR